MVVVKNDIETTLNKQKEYLERIKVFDSPDIYQWVTCKGKYSGFRLSDEFQNSISKIESTNNTIFNIRMASILVVGLIGTLIVSGILPIAFSLLNALILLGVLLMSGSARKLIKRRLGKEDNSPMWDFSSYEEKVYKDLHRLVYVHGEYYRVWYIKYILRKDEQEFIMEEDFNVYVYNKSYHAVSQEDFKTYFYEVEYLIEQALSDRTHWINSLPTARLLTYKEFKTVLETDELVNETKEMDMNIELFERYMKNKDKLQKERYGE